MALNRLQNADCGFVVTSSVSDNAFHVSCIEVFNQSSHKTHFMPRILQQPLGT